MVRFSTAQTDDDLNAILVLQAKNLPANISKQEAQEQGFVTVHHDLALLQRMNEPYPHVIALDGDKLVGYVLVMLRDLEKEIPVLEPMFTHINPILYKNKKLGDSRYFIMGQVCIAKAYRAKGLFSGLYDALCAQMAPHYDYIITEISPKNIPSQKAHAKVGFKIIKEYRADDGKDWQVVLLEL